MSMEQKPEGEPCDSGDGNPTPPGPSDGEKETTKCDPLPPAPTPPKLADPDPCETKCNCPSAPPSTRSCFDTLIDEQTKIVNEADRAKAFKTELEELLKKATAAKQAYTRDKFDSFKKRWLKLDEDIVKAIDIVTCNVKCWWCLIECEVCTQFYAIRDLEMRLGGSGTLLSEVNSLQDLQYWHQRNREIRAAVMTRIKDVLTAWDDPAKKIDANLAANEKLVQSIKSMEPSEQVLQLFLNLIPLHLTIAPRPVESGIDSKYIDLCCCDVGTTDDCCGPNVGVLSARERMTQPQAYIVDPAEYFDILCCLATERYLPAKNQLTEAESALAAISDKITRMKADLETRKKSVFTTALGNIATPIDCKKYTSKDGDDCGCDEPAKPSTYPTVR